MSVSNWRRNERQAAARLGLALHEPSPEDVTGFDVEMSDGSRVVLTILKSGCLSVQSYRPMSRGGVAWHLSGSTIVEAPDLTDFARTVLAGAANSCKRAQTARKNAQKTTSEKVVKKPKEIRSRVHHNLILSDIHEEPHDA